MKFQDVVKTNSLAYKLWKYITNGDALHLHTLVMQFHINVTLTIKKHSNNALVKTKGNGSIVLPMQDFTLKLPS